MDVVERINTFIEKQMRAGLVPKKIREEVHRGGKTFTRERTVMVKPEDISEEIKSSLGHTLMEKYTKLSDKDLILLGRKNLNILAEEASEQANHNRSLAQYPPRWEKDWDKWREEHKELAGQLDSFSHRVFLLSVRAKR